MDGVMTKEFVFEEFKKLETNQQKAISKIGFYKSIIKTI